MSNQGIRSDFLYKEFDFESHSEHNEGKVYLPKKNDTPTKYKTLEGKKLGTLKKLTIFLKRICWHDGPINGAKVTFQDGTVLEDVDQYYAVLADED